MSGAAQRLRELFARPGAIRLMGAHDALGAQLAERAGFDGVWSSGLEISTSYGVPDANILTMSEFLAAGQAMCNVVRIPVVADCDTGFGNSNNVIHLVKKFEAAGIAAVCIEDKLFPKVNSFVPGRQELAPVAEFVGKIMAAKNAQTTPEFIVIARVEALIAGWGMEEALRRAHAYVEAGADAILIHSNMKTPQQIMEFAKVWGSSAPLVVVPTTYSSITAQELAALGIKMVIYANHGMRAAIQSMLEVYREILEKGTTAPIESRIAPMKLVFELQGMPQFKRDEETFQRAAEAQIRAIIPAAGDHLNVYSMKEISSDIPMAMLDVNGKPLLRRQRETLNLCGIQNVTVTGGYKCEKIDVEAIKLAENPQWETTGEMTSILVADSGDHKGRTLVAYSDILFDSEAVNKLLKSQEDIVLLVDRTYDSKNYSPEHKIDLVSLADSDASVLRSRRAINVGGTHRVSRIGKDIPPAEAHCEFTGLALFSQKGWRAIREIYEKACSGHRGPFHEARSVEKASLTDVLQEAIDQSHAVECVEISSGWMEIHSFEDYKLASKVVSR